MNDEVTYSLSVRGLSKSFGGAHALKDVDLDIAPGEFVALMGPNGAGKSTLIKILDGLYAADSGEIRFGGERVSSLKGLPQVAFIHQELGLIESLSIVENLRLGQQKLVIAGPILDRRRERELARRALDRVHVDRDVDALVGTLSPGEKALIAAARALDRGARFLVVDETTSTLPPAHAQRLIRTLAEVAHEGATVVMVSHKLHEILDGADRVVVLIDGKVAADQPRAGLDREGLVRLLLMHESQYAETRAEPEVGKVLALLEDLYGENCGPINLELREGEVVGLTGLPGSGLYDVGFIVAQLARPVRGKIKISRNVTSAFVPPHRETQGGFWALTTLDNLTLSGLRRWRASWRLLQPGRERADGGAMLNDLDVRPSHPDARFGGLSGGNKQKVIFGRALLTGSRIFVLCEPTRGVDVATRRAIYRLIRRMADRERAGVLVVTSDAEDLFAVCDRVGVITNGAVGAFRPVDALSTAELEEFV